MGKVEKTCPSAEKRKMLTFFKARVLAQNISSYLEPSLLQSASVSEGSRNEIDCLNKKSEFIKFYKRKKIWKMIKIRAGK